MQRRIFLKGVGGVVFGLPLLEGLLDSKVYAQSGADPGRFALFFRQGNGVVQSNFWPTALGNLSAATMGTDRGVSPLKAHLSKLLIVKGINHPFANMGCDHAFGGAQALTAARPQAGNPVNRTRAGGESIDNLIARTLLPGSEPLTLYAGNRGGYLDEVLSYRGSKDLRSGEQSPYNAYRRLFGMSTGGEEGPEDMQALQRKSVNDFVRDQMKALLASTKISADDRNRLQLHQQSIRDLEIKIAKQLSAEKIASMQSQSTSSNYSNNSPLIARLHMDVMAISVAAGVARSATLQMGNGNDGTAYTIGGKKLPSFHRISHRVNSDNSDGPAIEGAEEMHHQIDMMHGELFSYLLDTLNSYTYSGKTLLDFGCAVWLNDLAEGPSHSHKNVPHVVAGSCGGALRVGQYIDAKAVMNNKFLNAIGAACGVKNGEAALDNFGDSSLAKGTIAEMMA